MATELKVPSLGMDMEEASIIRWLVKEGAEVEKGQPILEIDTDKTSFEIEAPADGILRNIQGKEGASVPVGATLAYIAAPDEKLPEPDETRPEQDDLASEENGQDAASKPQDARRNGKQEIVRASPAARRVAADRGITLENIASSGPHGRVYLSDVLEADVRQQDTPPEPSAAPASRREPLSRVRRLGAERTAKSFRDVPHFYLTRDLDADRLVTVVERLKQRLDTAPSITGLLALAVARTLKNHPRLNGRYVEGELQINDSVNLGIAVATDQGLVVPVLEDAEKLSLAELVTAVKGLIIRAREGKLQPRELSGGTFTLSNLGMMEIDSFDAVINAPEAAILAVGRVRTVPEWRDGGWIPHRVISGTLSLDHRVADGADGGRFLMDLQAALTDWELLL